jgi:hypothetical protein
MLPVEECRKFAKSCRDRASESTDPKAAAILRNIAKSFSGLASQLNILAGITKDDAPQS